MILHMLISPIKTRIVIKFRGSSMITTAINAIAHNIALAIIANPDFLVSTPRTAADVEYEANLFINE